jgi:hypothetical protein
MTEFNYAMTALQDWIATLTLVLLLVQPKLDENNASRERDHRLEVSLPMLRLQLNAE